MSEKKALVVITGASELLTKTFDMNIVEERWGDMMRVVVALKKHLSCSQSNLSIASTTSMARNE